jgi:hypothetical protein
MAIILVLGDILMAVQDDLRDLHSKGGGWREFFEMLSTYTNRRSDIQALRAAKQVGLAYQTVVGFLKDLDALGVGKFKFGRRGGKTRLIWNFSPRSVGDVARGTATMLEPYEAEGSDEESAIESPAPEPPKTAGPTVAMMIAEAKNALAAKMGISPDQISISFKF